MAENPTAGLTLEEEDENIDYDSDGNPIAPTTKKIILPLPPIDHTEVRLVLRIMSQLWITILCFNVVLKYFVVIYVTCFS